MIWRPHRISQKTLYEVRVQMVQGGVGTPVDFGAFLLTDL